MCSLSKAYRCAGFEFRMGGQRFSLQPQSPVPCSDPMESRQSSIGVPGNNTDRLIKLLHIYKGSMYRLCIYPPFLRNQREERVNGKPQTHNIYSFSIMDAVLDWAAITKIPHPGDLKKKVFISHNFGTGKCKIKALEDSVSRRACFLVHRLPPSHGVLP